MAAVHPVFKTRAARHFREYSNFVESTHERVLKKWELAVKELATRGKIKREIVGRVQQLIIDLINDQYTANLVLRRDPVVVSSKLSSKYYPVQTSVAYLSPSFFTIGGSRVDALIVNILAAQIQRDELVMATFVTGIKFNFHAIARLEERGIENNPFQGIADNLNLILKFYCMYLGISKILKYSGVVIPYGEHLLFGDYGPITFDERKKYDSGVRVSKKNADILDIEAQYNLSLNIRTAVDYDVLSESQDELREKLNKFADDYIEEINIIFETHFTVSSEKPSKEEYNRAVSILCENFTPISNMPEWKRSTEK